MSALKRVFLLLILLMQTVQASCVVAPFFVRGHSLEPLIKDGQTIEGNLGDCPPGPKKGDLILFKHLGFDIPLLKIVVGVPGDRFDLKKSGKFWNLIINKKIAKNSANIPYKLILGKDSILHLYLKGTHGIIPKNNWLVMGDNPNGTDDSSRFGLIPKQDILGFVKSALSKI